MARKFINIDKNACAIVMRRFSLSTKCDAVNFALRALASQPLSVEEAKGMRGSGWAGDLDKMCRNRTFC